MNILTMNVLQETAGLLPGTAMGRAGGTSATASFANFLTKTQAETGKHLDNLFGVPAASAAGAGGEAGGPGRPLDKAINLEAIDTVAGLLQQMMALLRQQADPVRTGPGDWEVAVPDTGLLEQLGVAAGMTSEQVGKFVQPLVNNKAKISLGQLLDAMASYFATLAKGQPITVPDTDLPLFQSLLAQMGIEVESLDVIAAKVITKDDTLDLSLLLAALKDLPVGAADQAVPLSPLDLEQLQAVLRRAGLSADKLRTLLATAGAQSTASTQSIQSTAGNQTSLPAFGEQPVATLSVQGLKDLLARAIQNIQAARPQVDPTAFLQRLEEVFTQAGFKEQGVGWTPVVQNAIESIYQKLLATVDQSTVQVSGVKSSAAPVVPASGRPASTQPDQSQDQVGLFGLDTETEAETPEAAASPVAEPSPPGLEAGPEKFRAALDHAPQPAAMAASSAQETVVAQVTQEPASLPRTVPVLVQQTMEQLSQGVLHGARNNEHHLVLKLFPEDLGEVKVVLHVRNEQVSVDFSMHNHQVKEILEQHMQQFRDNLEKHGFVLEQCSASLDYHDKANGGQQGFDLAMQQPWEGGRVHVAKLPEDVLYRQAAAPARAGGIDLFM